MKYKLKDEDYLNLWMYFQDKAVSVKGAMFNTITWIIGFAAALLGFIFSNLMNFDSSKAEISLSTFVMLASGSGLVICLYAFLALSESAKHIKKNWNYADQCLNSIDGLSNIISPNEGKNNKDKIMKIWNQLRIVVLFFTAAFIVVFTYAFKI